MAKIETITEMIVDEVNHMEILVKEFKKEKEDLKKTKIEPNLNNLGKLLEANLQYISKQNKEHREIIQGSIIKLKVQNKRMLLFVLIISTLIVLLIIELIIIKWF